MTVSHPPLRDSYEGLLSQAQMARRAGNTEGAINLYRRLMGRLARLDDRILKRRPDLGELRVRAGLEFTELLRRQGRYAEAYETMRMLAAAHPQSAGEWRQDLALLRVARGEVDAGLAELRALAEEDASNPAGWVILGREARLEGRLADSQAALDRALELGGKDNREEIGEVHYQRFLLFREMGRIDGAIAAWNEAVTWDPERKSTVRELYTMLANAGLYAEAQRYIDLDENLVQKRFQQGLIAQLTGNGAKAKAEWQAVAELDPGSYQSGHDCWIEAVLRLGDSERALERLQALMPQLPTSPRLLTLAGMGWAMRGDTELAGALLQQAINQLRRHRPPKQKLDGADWRLLNSLAIDAETKTALKSYFAAIETVWG